MVHMVIRHKVADFEKWKNIFDEHLDFRQKGGSKSATVFQNSHDPDEVVMVFEWESEEKAHEFMDSDDLKETMKNAGVTDKPDIYFLNEADKMEA